MKSKQDQLPIYKTEFGFQQKSFFKQLDLYHEEVIELDSPFEVVKNHSSVYTKTIVIIGDQNAGKTTFLHSFCGKDDLHFTELMGEFPMLCSTFLNTRFLSHELSAMDEAPFIDTDIARTTVLFSTDDWNFFLSEHDMAVLDTKCHFVCLQFVEIGGDHLDRIMNIDKIVDPKIKEICSNSLRLIEKAEQVAYVINSKTFNQTDVQSRFNYFKSITENFLVFISRYESFDTIVNHFKSQFSVCRYDLLTNGDINVQGIVEITLNMLKNLKPKSSSSSVLNAEHIIGYWKDFSQRYDGKSVDIWLNAKGFYDYVQEEDFEILHSAPHSSVIQSFTETGKTICDSFFAMQRFSENLSDFSIVFHVDQSDRVYYFTQKKCDDDAFMFRFPLYEPLFKIYDDFFQRSIPSLFWMNNESTHFMLDSVIESLENYIANASQDPANWELVLLLIDDWILANKRKHKGSKKSLIFPKVLESSFIKFLNIQEEKTASNDTNIEIIVK